MSRPTVNTSFDDECAQFCDVPLGITSSRGESLLVAIGRVGSTKRGVFVTIEGSAVVFLVEKSAGWTPQGLIARIVAELEDDFPDVNFGTARRAKV